MPGKGVNVSDQLRIPGVPSAEEEKKANFKLDIGKSFALLVITPVHYVSDNGEKDYIHVQTTIEIKPYPNPYGFGGMWGSGTVDPEKEKNTIDNFHHLVDPWIERGLTRVEIKHAPEETKHAPTAAQLQAEDNRLRNQSAGQSKRPDQAAPGQPTLF